jgi:hypothetical protein
MALWDRDRDGELDSHRLAAWRTPVIVRLAVPADLGALERLGALDSRALPAGPHLVAEREGRIDAALSLSTGEVVADPFRRTDELCELLRCHAAGARLTIQPLPLPRLRPSPLPVSP